MDSPGPRSACVVVAKYGGIGASAARPKPVFNVAEWISCRRVPTRRTVGFRGAAQPAEPMVPLESKWRQYLTYNISGSISRIPVSVHDGLTQIERVRFAAGPVKDRPSRAAQSIVESSIQAVPSWHRSGFPFRNARRVSKQPSSTLVGRTLSNRCTRRLVNHRHQSKIDRSTHRGRTYDVGALARLGLVQPGDQVVLTWR